MDPVSTVNGYIRNGSSLYYELPNGKYIRVQSGPRMQIELNRLVERDELNKIRNKYEDEPRYTSNRKQGKCQDAASDVVKYFKQKRVPVEVHQFRVNDRNNHVIAYARNKYYDFTGKQYGNKNLVFSRYEIPSNYKFVGIAPISFYMWRDRDELFKKRKNIRNFYN